MSDEEKAKNGSGASGLISLLNQMNVPTLLAVMFFGGGNLIKTSEDGRATREEQQQVIRQVRDLHDALDDFENRQKKMLSSQSDSLRNQGMMLENQSKILEQLHQR